MFGNALQVVLEIDVVKPVSHTIALPPFEVIEYSPMEVSFNIHTIPVKMTIWNQANWCLYEANIKVLLNMIDRLSLVLFN